MKSQGHLRVTVEQGRELRVYHVNEPSWMNGACSKVRSLQSLEREPILLSSQWLQRGNKSPVLPNLFFKGKTEI